MAWITPGTDTNWQTALVRVRDHAEANGWTRDRYDTAVGGDSNVNQWIAHSSDAAVPVIGIRTFYDSNADAYNWELAGATAYNSGGSDWNTYLTGISPGRYDGVSLALQYGAYVPLQNATISYWISATNRRIIAIFKSGTTYSSLYLGLLNPMATTGEYPYPLCIAGSTPFFDTKFNSSRIGFSGLADPCGANTASVEENGPMLVRSAGGVWTTFRNARESGAAAAEEKDRVVFPAGQPNTGNTTLQPNEANRWINTALSWNLIIPGVRGTETAKLYKTDDSGGDLAPIKPCTLLEAADANTLTIYGELDDVGWVSAAPGQTDGSVTSEDTITIGSDTWHVFQQGNRSEDYSLQAIKQG
jgi:hypothetical protein